MSKNELISLINESKPIRNEPIKNIKNFRRLKKDKDIDNRVLKDIKIMARNVEGFLSMVNFMFL